MVNLRINGLPVSVEEGTTILEAAKKVGIKIPTLCHMKEKNEIGACRICVVEVKGARSHVASCVFPVSEGMEVFTNTPGIRKARKTTIELILSDHKKDCLSCSRNLNCELQALSAEYGCDSMRFIGETNNFLPDTSTDYIVRDNTKCILCRRCVATCKKVQEVAVIGANGRGFKTHIGCAFEGDLKDSPCVACGQCINVCPTGALHEREEIDNVLDAINNPDKIVIAAAAPSVRAALAEEFGYPIGTNSEGKMASALKMLGFDKIFDVNFAADMTIIEESNELLERINKGGRLPMFTSCSPGWVRYLEFYYPELIPNLSSCKSPQQMFGALTKTYYAEKMNIDPKRIYTVSIMPCVAKKFEKLRDDEEASGYADIDAVLTTRELAKLIKRAGILFEELPNGTFDNPMGDFTGAGVIFGATGGVMEAALRTAVEKITGKEMENLEYKELRGTKGIKEATYNVGGLDIKVAVASGIANAKVICDMIRKGECDYHFIEIMCCPGGCVNGGGQPIVSNFVRENNDVKTLRAKVLYDEDAALSKRKSHDNPFVKEVYDNYLGEVGGHKAHHILHTAYVKRNKY